jgi:hypothetical protein
MALIECDECQAEMSSKAKQCPKCGYPIESVRKQAFRNRLRIILFLGFGSLYLLTRVASKPSSSIPSSEKSLLYKLAESGGGQENRSISERFPLTFAFLMDARQYFRQDGEGDGSRYERFLKKYYVRDPDWEASHGGLPNLGQGVIGEVHGFAGKCFDDWSKKKEFSQCEKAEAILKKRGYL